MNNKVIIIYQSIYNGNTKKLAEAMAQELHCKALSVEVAKDMDISTYDYIGLGSGIYFTSHHPELINIAGKLQKGQRSFIFSSHGAPFLGHYHQKLKTQLKEQGVEVIGEYSCKGYDCTGPYNLYHGGNKGKPNEKDLLKAKKFVAKILPQYIYKVTMPAGAHVYVEQENCIGCGLCAKHCPMQVLELDNKKMQVRKDSDCVHCSLCVKYCSEGAIAVKHTKRELISIAKNHAWRKSL